MLPAADEAPVETTGATRFDATTKYQNDYTPLNHPSLFCHDGHQATVGLTGIKARVR